MPKLRSVFNLRNLFRVRYTWSIRVWLNLKCYWIWIKARFIPILRFVWGNDNILILVSIYWNTCIWKGMRSTNEIWLIVRINSWKRSHTLRIFILVIIIPLRISNPSIWWLSESRNINWVNSTAFFSLIIFRDFINFVYKSLE